MKNKIGLGVTFFIAFILGGLSMYYFTVNFQPDFNNGSVESGNSYTSNLASTIDEVNDSVVMVITYGTSGSVSLGSGFVYKVDDKYTYILTNHHVVEDGAKWTVVNSEDKEVPAIVLGSDKYFDLAVVRIARTENMPAVSIGNVDKISLGDQVFLIGNPLDYEYRGTVTSGIISGKERFIKTSDDTVIKAIHTDAAINSGNSGGPLFNANGEVIGIVSAKLVKTSVEGMGFAISIDLAMKYVDDLTYGKRIERPVLDITTLNVDGTYKTLLYNRYGINVDDNITSGAVVVDVPYNSVASMYGLRKGDVITKVDSSVVTNADHLQYLIYNYKVGDTVELTYYRNGQYNTARVSLTKN